MGRYSMKGRNENPRRRSGCTRHSALETPSTGPAYSVRAVPVIVRAGLDPVTRGTRT
jgi:hypothetical protein